MTLFTVRSHWAEVWKMSSHSIPSINTSYSEITMSRGVKGVIVLHSLNKYFEYDDTLHTSAHCDLTVCIIYWVDGVWWHLSHLCSLWPHCMKYLLREWSTMTPFTPLLIVISLYEVFIEGGCIVLHPLNKFFIQWGHNEQRCERCHHTPSPQ
jgi:hypothetical protein